MCGGIFLNAQAFSSGTVRQFRVSRSVGYHFGRLLSYLTLGVIAGALGNRILTSSFGDYLTGASALLFIGAGMNLLLDRKRGVKGITFIHHLTGVAYRFIYEKSLQSLKPVLLGVLSGILPCGWLHLYVFGAVLLAHPLYSPLFLFAFWLGTIPIFHLLSGVTSFLAAKGVVGRKLAGVALVVYGLFLPIVRLTEFGHSMVSSFIAHGPQLVELGLRDRTGTGVSVDTFPPLCLSQYREGSVPK
jgi:sulfite exporter TauE/SafE